MRIAIAHIIHESNTFNPVATTFAAFTVRRGQEIIDFFSGAQNEITGFLDGAEAYEYDALPIYSALASPSGTVTAEALATITHQLLAALQAALPFDGILLALHGAFVSTKVPSADGKLVRDVRALFPLLPIVVTHDPHCNVSEVVPSFADALLMYQTNPHIDQRARGLQAAKIIAAMVRGTVKPTQAFKQIPMMINIVHQHTSSLPLRDLWLEMRGYETKPGVLAASISLGYQYSDVPAMGTAVCVVTDQDQFQADSIADDLASKLWALRTDLDVQIPTVAGAVALAIAAMETPIIVVDIGDNVGGGSAADSTFVLDELLKQGADGWVVVLSDPQASRKCADGGIGCRVTIDVGGKTDNLHGKPIRLTGLVKCLHDGKYEERAARHGGIRWGNMGLTALLEIQVRPDTDASYIVLTSLPTAPTSLHQLTALGIDPQYMKILVVKAAVAWKAAYEPIMKSYIIADSPGATQVNPKRWQYNNTPKNLWGQEGW